MSYCHLCCSSEKPIYICHRKEDGRTTCQLLAFLSSCPLIHFHRIHTCLSVILPSYPFPYRSHFPSYSFTCLSFYIFIYIDLVFCIPIPTSVYLRLAPIQDITCQFPSWLTSQPSIAYLLNSRSSSSVQHARLQLQSRNTKSYKINGLLQSTY